MDSASANRDDLPTAGLREVSNRFGRLTGLDLGATLLSWQPAGDSEVLFLSRDARFEPGAEIHGGIPICAPWFGQGRDEVSVPRGHGLVRWVPWHLVQQSDDLLAWELTADQVAHLPGAADYPADLRFYTKAQLGAELRLSFTVESPSTEFVLDEAFHCYFQVADLAEVVIDGLAGVPFRDYTRQAQWFTEQEPLKIQGPTDRVYHQACALQITDANRSIRLTTSGAASSIVWNPGPGPDRDGLAGDQWQNFVCVEVGNVQTKAITVPAGGCHTLELRISVTNRNQR